MDEGNILKNVVRAILGKNGFRISSEILDSSSYDIVASKDNEIYIIKVLYNVDTFKKEAAEELKLISKLLKAKALIVGIKCGLGKLDDYVLYSRYDIPVLSLKTFTDLLKYGEYPFSFAAPGGYYAKINGKKLREFREKYNISLGDLAKIANVSRKSIQLYEEGNTAVSLDVIARIEEYFNETFMERINPFENLPEPENYSMFLKTNDVLQSEFHNVFRRAGYTVYFTRRSSIDALSTNRDELIFVGISKFKKELINKATMIENITEITSKDGIVVTVTKEDTYVRIPVISLEELERAKDKDDVKSMILEKKFRTS